jgi:cytochrome c oxidase cbb3-type subunit IV
MDINDLRGISTAFLLFAFLAVCFWAYSKKRTDAFEEAANIPFADEPLKQEPARKEANNV